MPSLTNPGEDAAAPSHGSARCPHRQACLTMEVELHRAALLVFAGLMVIAAFEDFRRLIIPNWLTLALALLWPIYLLAASSLSGALGAIGCALAVFAVGALCFARGYVGGGDVK